jgi:Flp pilus assembly protein TadG
MTIAPPPSLPAADLDDTALVRAARPTARRRRVWRLLRHDERGSPAVEFVLAAPIMLLMMTAFVEFGMYMLVQVLIEDSLRNVARYGITGQVPPGGNRVVEMQRILKQGTHGLVDINDVVITIQAYPTFDDVGKGEAFVDGNANGRYDAGETFKDYNSNGQRDDDCGTDGAGNSREVVAYRVDYDWPMWTGMLAPIIGRDGKLHIRATTVARNEPWDADSVGREAGSCSKW